MTTQQSRRSRRQGNLLVLFGAVLAVALLIAVLTPLVPPAQPLPTLRRPVTATCEEPQPTAVPVPITSSALLSCPEIFDGRLVALEGEAIGEALRGPDGRRWVQVNDDAYAVAGPLSSHHQTLGTNSGIAVLLPPGVSISTLGGPGVWGDLLQVVGTYAAAAAEDQGGPAVIARTATLQRPGLRLDPSTAQRLRIVTPIAISITLALLIAAWRRRVGR